jgi:ADP-ribose pyrophosphatase
MNDRCINKTLLHHGRVFDFVSENVSLENGVTVDMEIIRHPGAAAIVPVTESGGVLMLKQYRYALDSHIWEIPAGTRSGSETVLNCARRELTEETGYTAQTWNKLGELTPVPGYSDERIHLFLARDLSPAAQNLDEDEILAVHEIDFTAILDMIIGGAIQDAKTIGAIFMAQRYLEG